MVFVCPEPKPSAKGLLPGAWPKLNPVEVELFPNEEKPNGDAVVVGAAKGLAVAEAEVLVFIPKTPPEVVEVLDGGWPKRLVVLPPLTGWPKENFGGSDIVAGLTLERNSLNEPEQIQVQLLAVCLAYLSRPRSD